MPETKPSMTLDELYELAMTTGESGDHPFLGLVVIALTDRLRSHDARLSALEAPAPVSEPTPRFKIGQRVVHYRAFGLPDEGTIKSVRASTDGIEYLVSDGTRRWEADEGSLQPTDAPPEPTPQASATLTVGGKPYRCQCGCNVFTRRAETSGRCRSYRCNACGEEFEGEPTPQVEPRRFKVGMRVRFRDRDWGSGAICDDPGDIPWDPEPPPPGAIFVALDDDPEGWDVRWAMPDDLVPPDLEPLSEPTPAPEPTHRCESCGATAASVREIQHDASTTRGPGPDCGLVTPIAPPPQESVPAPEPTHRCEGCGSYRLVPGDGIGQQHAVREALDGGGIGLRWCGPVTSLTPAPVEAEPAPKGEGAPDGAAALRSALEACHEVVSNNQPARCRIVRIMKITRDALGLKRERRRR